jgi:sec-independent protein translocase protein TatC
VYFIWSFIAPGLEEKEKRYVRFIVPGATFLFILGVAFAWAIMLPAAIGFLSTFEPDIFKTSWRAAAYIPFVTSLMFWIGVAFQLPLIVFFLAKLKIVTAKKLLSWWRFAFVGAAIVAALITPTVDPFNMMLVMAPLIFLYFLSVGLAKLAR